MIMAKYSSFFYLEFRTKFTTSKNYRWDYALREQIPNSYLIDLIIKSPFLSFLPFLQLVVNL